LLIGVGVAALMVACIFAALWSVFCACDRFLPDILLIVPEMLEQVLLVFAGISEIAKLLVETAVMLQHAVVLVVEVA
jgi:hypothetical protein